MNNLYCSWIDSTFWYKGIVVKHNGIIYRAENLTNSAEPGNKIHEYFYVCQQTLPDVLEPRDICSITRVILCICCSVVLQNQDLSSTGGSAWKLALCVCSSCFYYFPRNGIMFWRPVWCWCVLITRCINALRVTICVIRCTN